MKSLLALVFATLVLSASAAEKPNVVLVLVDDMGWMDLSCQGSDYFQTPSIDRLASEGMRFTDGYAACAVCSPTRAAVQTGRYPHRIGVTDWIRSRFQRGGIGTPEANPTEWVSQKNRKLSCPPNPYWMEHDEITLAEILRENGYATGYIGKWHLGDPDWYPEHQGFEENRGGCDYGQPPNFFDPYNQPKGKHESLREGIYKLPGREPGQYLTHREGEEAVELIQKWHGEERPFFLQISHYAVHTPIQALKEVAAKYQQEGKTEVNAKYAAMVESVDDSMRMVLDELQKLGIDDDTMIIFTSDNGGLDRNGGPTENAPLRSGKGYAYEGGIRVPLLVRWPGKIPGGSVSDEPAISIDLFPTVLDAVDMPTPADRPIDGLSLLPHLKSGGETALGRDSVVWHFPHYRHDPGPYSMIREGDWKLIHFLEGIDELYNLADDLGEETNLAESMPEKVAALKAAMEKQLAEQEAKIPIPNPDYVAK